MKHKTFDILETKADQEAGTFEALVSVFGNVDLGGDRMVRGAFKRTLKKWEDSGDPIPVILSHQWDNPMAHIGIVNEARETSKGLWVKGTLDVNENDVARQVHRLMMRRSLKEFSFGYTIPDGGSKRAKDGAYDVTDVDLVEVGPTLKGMNPATELQAVKSALETKASGMAGVLERMAALVDRQEAPSEDEVLALARYINSQFGDGDGETGGKAVWSAAYVNDLPDSSFLYIEPGGDKDEDGKTTPRSLRHFPVKDADGTVDLPHLRNALARIPQSNLPQAVKDRVTAAAQRMLDNSKNATDPGRRTQSDERKAHELLAQQVAMGFREVPKPPEVKVQDPQEAAEEAKALRRYTRDLMSELITTTGAGFHGEPL